MSLDGLARFSTRASASWLSDLSCEEADEDAGMSWLGSKKGNPLAITTPSNWSPVIRADISLLPMFPSLPELSMLYISDLSGTYTLRQRSTKSFMISMFDFRIERLEYMDHFIRVFCTDTNTIIIINKHMR